MNYFILMLANAVISYFIVNIYHNTFYERSMKIWEQSIDEMLENSQKLIMDVVDMVKKKYNI